MRLSFPGISGPERMDDASLASKSSPNTRPYRCRTPGEGSKLKETRPGQGLYVFHGSPPPNSPRESWRYRVPLFGSVCVFVQ